jgi:tetratricopeptide (TPR) repeat protein
VIKLQPGPLDYLVSLLHQQLSVNEGGGLRAWQSHFAAARAGWQVEMCQKLLRVVKGHVLLPDNQAIVRHDEGVWLAQWGRWEEALTRYQSSLGFFEKISDAERVASAANNLGLALSELGWWDKAVEYYRRSLAFFRESGDHRNQAITLNNLAIAYREQGRWNEATDCIHQALTLFRDLNDPHGESPALHTLGTVLSDQGRWGEAVDCYEQALAIK